MVNYFVIPFEHEHFEIKLCETKCLQIRDSKGFTDPTSSSLTLQCSSSTPIQTLSNSGADILLSVLQHFKLLRAKNLVTSIPNLNLYLCLYLHCLKAIQTPQITYIVSRTERHLPLITVISRYLLPISASTSTITLVDS